MVRIVAPESNIQALGSGTLVHVTQQHGLIITNWHVVRDATGPVQVLFPDGFRSAGTVMKIDEAWDLAAIGIWRPRAQPVQVATEPPSRGDPLTIAGYGQGQYRAIQGQCTQYVAPGKTHPYEMIELSAEARQGDSGGPILNSQGQLAGVLLGARDGRTVGSFCGRVLIFLADARRVLDQEQHEAIVRQQQEREQDRITRQPEYEEIAEQVPEPEPIVRRRKSSANALVDVFVARDDLEADTLPTSSPESRSLAPVRRQLTDLDPPPPDNQQLVRPPTVAAIEQQRQDEFFRPAVGPRPSFVPQAVPLTVQPQSGTDEVLRLTDVIGQSTGEQIKSILAAIGVLSLIVFTSRLMRVES